MSLFPDDNGENDLFMSRTDPDNNPVNQPVHTQSKSGNLPVKKRKMIGRQNQCAEYLPEVVHKRRKRRQQEMLICLQAANH